MTPWLTAMCLVVLLFPLAAAGFAAEQGAANGAAVSMRGRLDQLTLQADTSFHQLVKKSYVGYLGLRQEDLLADQELLTKADTMFTDLNELLKARVEPLVADGKQLSRKYFETVGDRTYLDKFTLQDLRLRGLIFSNAEEYAQGREQLQQAVTLARTMNDREGLAFSLNNLAYCDFHLKNSGEALEAQKEAVAVSESLGDPAAATLFMYNLGWIHLNRGDLRAAMPVFEKTARLSEQSNNPIRQVAALVNLASAQMYLQRFGEAETNLNQAMQISNKINSLRFRGMAGLDLAVLRSMTGQYPEAVSAVEEVLSIFAQDGDRVFMKAERQSLEQKAAAVVGYVRTQSPGSISPALAAKFREHPKVTGPLHSHFEHLSTPLVPTPESYEEAALPQGAAQPKAEKEMVRIRVMSSQAVEGTTFSVPVYLSFPSGTKLHSVAYEMAYPKDVLELTKVDEGFLLSPVKATVDTKTAADPADEKQVVSTVTVTAGEDNGKKLALPSGLIMYFHFNVPEKATRGALVPKDKIARAETIEGTVLGKDDVSVESPTLTIVGPGLVPVTICFFYIH